MRTRLSRLSRCGWIFELGSKSVRVCGALLSKSIGPGPTQENTDGLLRSRALEFISLRRHQRPRTENRFRAASECGAIYGSFCPSEIVVQRRMTPAQSLTENDVVALVASYLAENGWQILSQASTTERGVDIEASKDSLRLAVEAKGATSASQGTARFGKPFDRNQVRSHVSRAFFTAASALSCEESRRTAMAFPDTPNHREFVTTIDQAIRQLQIGIFWVTPDAVELSGEWHV